MAYGLTYRMNFTDRLGMAWRVDFLLKDGPQLSEPIIIPTPAAEPLVIEWGKDENLTTPIIESKAYISYMVDDTVGLPQPEAFINIEENQWLIEVYGGFTAFLYWKGFVKPDNNKYPWQYKPFVFTINAVDFTFSKGTPMDLNSGGLLLYDFITMGQMINRTLFNSIGYENPLLKIVYSLRPAVIEPGQLPGNLYMHTDAFYSLDNGPDFSFDALTKLLKSMRARMFYAGGAYWLQRLAEIGGATLDVVTISPDDLIGTVTSTTDTRKALGAGPLDNIKYLDRSAQLTVNPALRKQSATYQLKAINQIKNFDWRTDEQSPFTNWEGDNTGFFQRIGTGDYQNPYKLHIPPPPTGQTRQIRSRIPVVSGQVFEINLKASAQNAKALEVYAVLVDAGTITPLQRMDEGGNWVPAAANSLDAVQLSVENKSNNGTLSVVSKRIPTIEGHPDLELLFEIGHVIPVDDVPIGQDVFVDLYPVFGRLFVNNYDSTTTAITSDKNYSYIPDDEELFFLDMVDNALSNTLYYNNGSSIVPLPNGNWDSKSIEERTARFMLDTYYNPSYLLEGTFFSNQLHFYNTVQLKDFQDKIMVLLRDKYSVRACTHEAVLTEYQVPDTGSGTFSETPLTRGI